jgi:hypothetical protein
MAVVVEILRTGVIAIGVAPGIRMSDQPVSVADEPIPVVACVCLARLILRIISPLNRDHLSAVDLRAALRSYDLRRTPAHRNLRFRIRVHDDAELTFAL